MGWFLEHEFPIIANSLIIPIGVLVGMYYTFERASREQAIGTKIGYIILGLLLLYLGVDMLRQGWSPLKSLF